MSTKQPAYGQVDRAYGRRLATAADEDGPVWMVNLMRYKPVANYADDAGVEGDQAAITGREADDRYTPTDVLADIGAEIVFAGDVEDQLLGDGPPWDRVGVVRYPTRRSFIDMQARKDFQARHVHKEAGMEATFVIGCVPAEHQPPVPGVPVPEWESVPHPSTEGDGPVMVIHVIRYAEATGLAVMARYEEAAARSAVPRGVQVAGWFDAEGTIVGDGRTWDQVRFNRFPSKAAFMAVVMDPARLEAQAAHRAPAMADTYTLIVRPTLDRMGSVDVADL